MEEKSSSDEGNFSNPNVDSSDENEKKLDINSKSRQENYNNDNNDNNNDNENLKDNNSSQYRYVTKGNEIFQNKQKDILQIEIDKEKTTQKKFTVYQINLMNDNSINFNNNIDYYYLKLKYNSKIFVK